MVNFVEFMFFTCFLPSNEPLAIDISMVVDLTVASFFNKDQIVHLNIV